MTCLVSFQNKSHPIMIKLIKFTCYLIPFYQIIREIIMFKQKYYFFLVGESCLILFASKFILLVRLLLWGSSFFQQGFCNGQVEPKPQQEQIDYWAEIDWNLFCFATFSQFSYSICRNRKRWWNQISRRYPDQIIQETNRATKVQRDWEIQFTIDTQFWKPPDLENQFWRQPVLETTSSGDNHFWRQPIMETSILVTPRYQSVFEVWTSRTFVLDLETSRIRSS